MKDIRQTKEYAQYLQKIGWRIEYRHGQYHFLKYIPLLGYAIKLQRTNTISLETLTKLRKQYRVFQIIIEPESASQKIEKNLYKEGFRISHTPYLPTKTLQIDIVQEKEAILAQMKKDTRYALRKSEHIVITEEHNIELFRASWKTAVGNKRHVLPIKELQALKESFRDKMAIFTNKDKTSGALFLCSENTCYYWCGFTNASARKSLVQYQVLWTGIQWAKKKKMSVFDFEGIYDSRFPNKSWIGFSHFKKSFGGVVKEFPGSYTKWRFPF